MNTLCCWLTAHKRHSLPFFYRAILSVVALCSFILSPFSPHLRAGSINDTVWTRYFSGGVDNIAYSADGSRLFAPAGDSIHILDAATGIPLRSFGFGISYFHHYADNEQNCVYFSNVDSSFHKRSLTDGKEVKSIYLPGSSYFSHCSYTPDGRYAIITTTLPFRSGTDNFIPVGLSWKVVDVQSGEVRQHKVYPIKPMYQGVDVQKVFLDPTGDTAIVEVNRSYGDGQGHWTYTSDIIVYKVSTGDSIGSYSLKGNPFQSPDGSRIILTNNPLTIVHTTTGEKLFEMALDLQGLTDIVLSSDNQRMGICRANGNWNLDILSLEEKKVVYNNPLGYSFLKFSPTEQRMAAQAGSRIFLYKFDSPSPVEDNIVTSNTIYPNPSTGEMSIRYFLKNEGQVSYSICSMQGITVAKEMVGMQAAGEHVLPIPTGGLSSGAYILRLQTLDGIQSFSFIHHT